MDWFDGPSLLEFLETVPVLDRVRAGAFRFPVQRVVRPDQNFRGYAGQIVSGAVRPGDAMLAFPSGQRSRVASIETFDGPLPEAIAPMSVTLTLEDELDISRGDMLASAERVPEVARQFEANVVWLSEQPLDPNRTYLLKHSAQTVAAEVKAIRHRVNINTLAHETVDQLEMNAIGVLRIETSRAIYFDAYTENRTTGSFILFDPATNATVAAGMILAAVQVDRGRRAVELRVGRVTAAERIARYRHSGAVLALGGREQLAWLLERRLFDRGCAVAVVNEAGLDAGTGLLVLLVSGQTCDWDLPSDDARAADEVVRRLEESGILLPDESLTEGEGI
jgi:sulfate adenylyltransferase subunit 1 (EFTu-like GTPase family)